MAERVFARKIANVGFVDLTVLERRRFSIDDASSYPLFTPELIELMRELIPSEQHGEVATAVTLVAHKPSVDPGQDR